MHADQDPGRLLLLCLRAAALTARPRHQLCAHGAGHVPGHQVSWGGQDGCAEEQTGWRKSPWKAGGVQQG